MSLSAGVAFATGITQVVVPCLYVVREDVENLLRKWAAALHPEPPDPEGVQART